MEPLARPLRIALTLAAAAGALAFAALLAVTYLVPDAVERAAQSFVRHEVTTAFRAKLGEAPFEAHVRSAIDRLCRRGCEARLHPVADRDPMARHFELRLAANDAAVERVTAWIQGRYLQTVRDLTREVRIFLACNALLFLAVAALGIPGRVPGRALLVPAAALFMGTTVAMAIYFVGQDWLYALIHDRFVGWTYAAWSAGMALVCLDLAANRGRATLLAVTATGAGIAGSFSALAACCP